MSSVGTLKILFVSPISPISIVWQQERKTCGVMFEIKGLMLKYLQCKSFFSVPIHLLEVLKYVVSQNTHSTDREGKILRTPPPSPQTPLEILI